MFEKLKLGEAASDSDPKGAPTSSKRVSRLVFDVTQAIPTEYAADVRLEVQFKGFTGTVTPATAEFHPTENFESGEAALAALGPQLNAWRIWVRLMEHDDVLIFTPRWIYTQEFRDGEMVGTDQKRHIGTGALQVHGSAPIRTSLSSPPVGFVSDELIEVGIRLFSDAHDMPQHASKFAYAFRTILAQHYGHSHNMAKELHIDRDVITEFTELISRGGELGEARKAVAQARLYLTEERRRWMITVFRELIRRHGNVLGGVANPTFTELCPGDASDFPQTPGRKRHSRA